MVFSKKRRLVLSEGPRGRSFRPFPSRDLPRRGAPPRRSLADELGADCLRRPIPVVLAAGTAPHRQPRNVHADSFFFQTGAGRRGHPSVVAPRCAATFIRSRFKWTRAFLVPRPRLASLSSTRPIFMTAPCTVKMVTPFGAACPPVVHARKVRSCSPHRQGMAFLCGFFRSLGGGDAAIDAGRLLSA